MASLRSIFAAGSMFAALTAATLARAQDSQADAQRMFEAGKRQLADKRYDDAIVSFQRVYAKYPSVGALFNIGEAYELTARPVAAWAAYVEAERLAHAKQDPREPDAAAKARALEPRLPRLVVNEKSAELIVTIKEPVPREEWNKPLRRAPGVYELVARARCKETATLRIVIADDERNDVVLPALADAPCGEANQTSPQRAIGFGVAGLGVASIAVGSVFGVLAMSTKSDLDRACGTYERCNTLDRATTDDLNSRAGTQATISTIGLAAGALLLAGGIVLVLTAAKHDGTRPSRAAGTLLVE